MPAIGISSSSSSFLSSDASTSFPTSIMPPSTIILSNADESSPTTTTVLPILRHRHHRVRPPPPPPPPPPAASSISDLIHDHNDTVLLIPPTNFNNNNNIRKQQPQIDNEKIKNTFAGGIFGRTSQPAGQSLASVFLLIFVLIGIVMILMLFYFLAKVCNGPDEERKGGKIKTKNGKIIVQHPDRRNEKIEIIPTKVPYPKRIYELQAEEGYYSCPPSIHQSLQDIFGDGEDDFFASNQNQNHNVNGGQRSRSMDDEPDSKPKKESQSTPSSTQFVRKLTGAGLPPNFKPKNRLQQLQGGS